MSPRRRRGGPAWSRHAGCRHVRGARRHGRNHCVLHRAARWKRIRTGRLTSVGSAESVRLLESRL